MKLSRKGTVLLIGVSHPNEVTFTLSREVSGSMDVEDAIIFMKAEMFLDFDDADLDELLVVDRQFNVTQIDPTKYE